MIRPAALALPLLLTACAAAPAGAPDLTGSKWALTVLDKAPARSAKAGIEFLPGRISATAGCNGLGGEWQAKGARLITGRFASTMMYCDGLMDQERALGELLESGPAYFVSGTELTLTGGGHTALFRRVN